MVHDREGMVGKAWSEAVAHIATPTKYQCINTKWTGLQNLRDYPSTAQ